MFVLGLITVGSIRIDAPFFLKNHIYKRLIAPAVQCFQFRMCFSKPRHKLRSIELVYYCQYTTVLLLFCLKISFFFFLNRFAQIQNNILHISNFFWDTKTVNISAAVLKFAREHPLNLL